MLEQLLEQVKSPIHLTPMTRDPVLASEWLSRFEGAGLDGVIVKPEDGVYEPGKRAMIKVKHARTADCVVAGFRWHKAGKNELVGSLLLGLYDAAGRLHHVGVTSSFTMARRKELAAELAPLRERRREIMVKPNRVKEILVEGSRKARGIAQGTMERVREAVKLRY
jgi:ATP-dependent DNA ligase